MAGLNIQIMILCVFLGGEKLVSEKSQITLEIRRIFKIPVNGVIIPVLKDAKIRFIKILLLHIKNRV